MHLKYYWKFDNLTGCKYLTAMKKRKKGQLDHPQTTMGYRIMFHF